MKRKKITIKDIAEKAGVSIGTVSRVFNEFDNVKPEIKTRVLSTADELNYSYTLKNKKQKSRIGCVGIIITERLSSSNAWTHQVVFNLVKTLGSYGYQTMIEFWRDSKNDMPNCIGSIDACVIWGDFCKEFYRNLKVKGKNIPVVSYSRQVPYDNSICILCKNQDSMFQVIEYLLANGHHKIGLVMDGSSHITQERYKGFAESMHDYGHAINENWMMLGKFDKNSDSGTMNGYEATKRILAQPEVPTAIIYGSDVYAFGGMEAIKEKGMSIPGDVSVIGFDNIPMSKDTFPPLTTMELNMSELAEMMAQAIEKLILGRDHDETVHVPRRLIRRQSVQTLNAG